MSSSIKRNGQHPFQYIVVLFVAITLNFALPRLMPGSPLVLLAGVDVGLLTEEERDEVRARVGLDLPLHQQYINYLGDILQGDFGYSYRQKQPIVDMLLARLPYTLLLTMSSLVLSAIIGIITGAVAAWWRAKLPDIVLFNSMIILDSLPSFWVGMLFISLLSVQAGLFPSQGALTPATDFSGLDYLLDILHHAALPILTLTLLSMPRVFLTMRNAMCGVLGAQFVRTARAKGIKESRILLRHMIRNALLPVVTVLALRFGFAFGGTVVIETVFSYPGLGRLIFEAVSGRDYPVMQATFLLFTIMVLVSNLLVDWLYPQLDPRVRSEHV
ncbi:MAG: ABC transporter permease [Chloroflexota bacterium]